MRKTKLKSGITPAGREYKAYIDQHGNKSTFVGKRATKNDKPVGFGNNGRGGGDGGLSGYVKKTNKKSGKSSKGAVSVDHYFDGMVVERGLSGKKGKSKPMEKGSNPNAGRVTRHL